MKTKNLKNNNIEEFKNIICMDFQNACKKITGLKTGLEIERLPVYKKTNKAVNYFGENGLYCLLRQFAYSDEWRYITDLTFINGLQKGNSSITLEPGGQTEYSLTPQKTIFKLKKEVETLDNKFSSILNYLGISMLEYPITPKTDGKTIEIIPKRRYQTMAKYMNGERCFSMMRETAGIQVAIDYTDEIDAMKKLKAAMMLSPFATAIFANSPIRCGKVTGYKSTRALAWLKTDENRCGLISEKLFNEDFSFNAYIEKVFSIPLLFIQRDDKIIEIGGKINFDTFLKNGYNEFTATKEDYILHSTLFFPEVRLKNIIEIRNQDTQKGDLKYSIPAFYKGLLYNSKSIDNILELLKDFTYNDFVYLRHEVPKFGLLTKIKNKKIIDYAKIILEEAYIGLKEQESNEEVFLEPIMELINDGFCPADLILKEWEHKNHNIDKLIDYVRLK